MKKINCKECVFSPFKQWSKNRVEVVRCKDCKYWHRDSATELNFCLIFDNGQGRQIILAREADDFCSRGAKRDE